MAEEEAEGEERGEDSSAELLGNMLPEGDHESQEIRCAHGNPASSSNNNVGNSASHQLVA